MSFQLPDPQTAYNTLVRDVHAAVFFDRAGQRGRHPTTEKQASEMLQMGAKLATAFDLEKQANDADPFAQANRDLDSALAESGLGNVKFAAAEAEAGIDAMASQMMGRPDIYNSVLSMKAAEAAAALQGYQPQA